LCIFYLSCMYWMSFTQRLSILNISINIW
jgi:hypothetical protein